MVLFLPINGPLWRMGIETAGLEFPFGELRFLVLSLFNFTIGCVLIFTPKIRFHHNP